MSENVPPAEYNVPNKAQKLKDKKPAMAKRTSLSNKNINRRVVRLKSRNSHIEGNNKKSGKAHIRGSSISSIVNIN